MESASVLNFYLRIMQPFLRDSGCSQETMSDMRKSCQHWSYHVGCVWWGAVTRVDGWAYLEGLRCFDDRPFGDVDLDKILIGHVNNIQAVLDFAGSRYSMTVPKLPKPSGKRLDPMTAANGVGERHISEFLDRS